MTPSVFRVTGFKQETSDTFSLELVGVSAGDQVAFRPGQFNMLYAFGAGEAAISVSGDPGLAKKSCVHTIRNVGSVTGLLARLKVGDELGLRGPFGTPWPMDALQGKDVVLVAGGIGLAPLRPVLYEIARQREKYGQVSLLYGARTPQDLLYLDELQEFARTRSMDVKITVDHADKSWRGRVGVVPPLISRASFDPQNVRALMCGPEVMMRFAVDELRALVVPESSIYLSLERSMKCGIGFCGHCQYAPFFICKDGPVFRFDRIQPFFGRKEL